MIVKGEVFEKFCKFLEKRCGSWRVTSKQRGSTLIQVARRRSKVGTMGVSVKECESFGLVVRSGALS